MRLLGGCAFLNCKKTVFLSSIRPLYGLRESKESILELMLSIIFADLNAVGDIG